MVQDTDVVTTMREHTTWNAAVTGFQVAGEVGQTRSALVHFRIGNPERAVLASGAVPIQYVDDVRRTADEAEVDAHAATDAHAPVPTGSDQDHVTALAPRRELFRGTEVCRRNQQEAFEKCWAHSPQRAASRPFSRCRYRYCRAPPAHRCPRRHRQRRRQRQRVTEGTAMAPWNGPNNGPL